MSNKRIYLTLMETDPKKYPNLCKTIPISYKINGKERTEREGRILYEISRHLLEDPKFVTFKNKIPETNLGKALDMLIRTYNYSCLLYTSPSPRDRTRSRMPSSA